MLRHLLQSGRPCTQLPTQLTTCLPTHSSLNRWEGNRTENKKKTLCRVCLPGFPSRAAVAHCYAQLQQTPLQQPRNTIAHCRNLSCVLVHFRTQVRAPPSATSSAGPSTATCPGVGTAHRTLVQLETWYPLLPKYHAPARLRHHHRSQGSAT